MLQRIGVLQASAPVPPAILRLVFIEALMMLRASCLSGRFRSEAGEGEVRTDRAFVVLGGLAGVRCTAEVDHQGGSTKFTCVVDDPGPWLDLNDPVDCAGIIAEGESPQDVAERVRIAMGERSRAGKRAVN